MVSQQGSNGMKDGEGGVATPPRPRKRRQSLDGWPPLGWEGNRGGGGGDGGGDDGGGGDEEPFDPYRGLPKPGASALAVTLALVCICTLFLVFVALALLLWKTAPTWPPPGAPEPPKGLWVSTALLLGCSVVLARATVAHRLGRRRAMELSLQAGVAIGLGFLASQAALWHELIDSGVSTSNEYVALFYILTGLHAVHILGGFAFLGKAIRTARAAPDGLGPASPLRLAGAYWHVMGGIWVALFIVLYFLR